MRILRFLCPLVTLVYLGGCDYARMYEQEYLRTYERGLPEMPAGTVPATGGIEFLKAADPADLKNPLSGSEAAVKQGQVAYSNFCIHCHGPRADGHGTVGQSFAPLPTNLAGREVQIQSDGELFVKILLGFKRHPSLATTISEEDTWAVIHYMRSLKTGGKE